MKLTVIDTPGFGDQINNENWYMSACEISALTTLNMVQIHSYENELRPPCRGAKWGGALKDGRRGLCTEARQEAQEGQCRGTFGCGVAWR